VRGGVDRAGEESRVDFFREQAFAARIGERAVLDRVAGGANDLERDPVNLPILRVGQAESRLIRL
jgi:hypothetical protein